jgi:hypothetical protein
MWCEAILALTAAQPVGATTVVTSERVFAVKADFESTCDAVLASLPKYRPTYRCFELWPDRGYAVCQIRVARIAVVHDVVLMAEVWRGKKTTIRLRSTGNITAGPFVRAIMLRRVRQQFAAELASHEKALRKKLGASDD